MKIVSRSEHIKWCKERAREYLNAGDSENAIGSMLSDLTKHPETKGLLDDGFGMIGILSASDLEAATKFIEGFAE